MSPPQPGEHRIRPLHPDDHERTHRFLAGLSRETLRSRFFVPGPLPDRLARQLLETTTSYIVERAGEVVALAGYAPSPGEPGTVELAVVVADSEQGRGLGSHLAGVVADEAARDGARQLAMTVLAENRRAVAAVRRGWPDARPRLDGTLYEYRIPLAARQPVAIPSPSVSSAPGSAARAAPGSTSLDRRTPLPITT